MSAATRATISQKYFRRSECLTEQKLGILTAKRVISAAADCSVSSKADTSAETSGRMSSIKGGGGTDIGSATTDNPAPKDTSSTGSGIAEVGSGGIEMSAVAETSMAIEVRLSFTGGTSSGCGWIALMFSGATATVDMREMSRAVSASAPETRTELRPNSTWLVTTRSTCRAQVFWLC